MPTASDIQTLLVAEVGDTTNRDLASVVSLVWDRFADKALIFPRLQELYAKRSLIDIALGIIRNQVNFSTDGSLSLSLSQRTSYLSDRRKETQEEIVRLEGLARANRPSVIAPLINTELEVPPAGSPDANDEVFRGSPYFTIGNGSN